VTVEPERRSTEAIRSVPARSAKRPRNAWLSRTVSTKVDTDGRRVGIRHAGSDDPVLDPRRIELGHETVDQQREPSVPPGVR
jgi:hypothetical protein